MRNVHAMFTAILIVCELHEDTLINPLGSFKVNVPNVPLAGEERGGVGVGDARRSKFRRDLMDIFSDVTL